MSAKPDKQPRVMISYSHDSEPHKENVLALADRLCKEGIDCHLDQYEQSPPEGWPRWMDRQIEEADFVLVICSEIYADRFKGGNANSGGLGVKWEGAIITQDLYEAAHNNNKFIPVIFSQECSKFRPKVLRAVTYYNVGTDDGYDDLYCRLTDQHPTPKPELGAIRSIPARPRDKVAVGNPSNFPSRQLASATIAESNMNESLVLLMDKQRHHHMVPSVRIESEATTVLHLTPITAHQTAFISSLRDSHDKAVAVAFGITAIVAKIEKITQLREGGKEVWIATLQEDKNYSDNSLLGASFNGWSSEDIAELRARRILLNEQIGRERSSMMDRLNAGMIENYVRGRNDYIGELHSPFPELYAKYQNDEAYFLSAARLFATLYLRLTGVVKHVLKLELKIQGNNRLSIKFEGQRPRYYSNVEPSIIKVKGSCLLVDSDEDDD